MMIRYAHRSLAKNGGGTDRIKVVEFDANTLCAVVADGSVAVSGGSRAADLIVEKLTQSQPEDFGSLFDSILELDSQLKIDPQAGLSTAVVVYTTGWSFNGAVVGDSEASNRFYGLVKGSNHVDMLGWIVQKHIRCRCIADSK